MKSLAIFALTISASLLSVPSADAQNRSEAGAVQRRIDRTERGSSTAKGPSERLQSSYSSNSNLESEMEWMRIIYRELDLTKAPNAPLYYPEEPVDGEDNMFRIIMRLMASNQLPAYEYLDGREIFTDDYRVKVRDVLERFHIPATDAKGSTEKNPKFNIEESDIPSNEVLSYYILERWEFDRRSNKTHARVEAICPVLHRSGDFGGEAIRYPMFWIKMSDLRPWLVTQNIFIDDDNNLARHTLDDFFAMNLYDGAIYKTRNLANKSMMQMFPDPDDLKRAQDSIQTRLTSFDSKLWVPSREEIIAERERREALAAGADTTAIAEKQAVATQTRVNSRSQRAKKPAKVKTSKPKAAKSPSSSSSAVRSVRKRK